VEEDWKMINEQPLNHLKVWMLKAIFYFFGEYLVRKLCVFFNVF